jgi:purine-binding chemotaxis protein CheW
MDILAARKRAAEMAKATQQEPTTPPAASPAERPAEPAANIGPEPVSPQVTSVHDSIATQVYEAEMPIGQEQFAEAVTPGEVQEQEEEQEMLAFLLGTEEYVVPVGLVGEVLTPRVITSVPHVPSHILGVCSLRGAVLPIIDLHRRLGLAAAVRDDRSRIIVTDLGPDDRVGLFVDRVRGVVRIKPSSVGPVPETVAQGEGAAFVRGIARKNDRLFILLDAEVVAGV